jgi:eukaryotic-like serine/threonine-protein kinase
MRPGTTIGKYRLINRIGRGGMGEVWLATQAGHGGFHKPVVIKTVLPELANDPMFVDMLAHEARVCGRLSHPNLVEVFDFSVHDGIYLLAMEHVTGWSLTEILRSAHAREWPLPPWFILRVAWECGRGLAHAHGRGVIHCDLSPSNVMLTTTGVTKILDFGVAHAAEHGPKADRLKGKFSYMAPERIQSLATDRRTDVYSLGVMLYLMFTQRLPFTADNDAQLMFKIVHQVPRPPSAYTPIDPIVEELIIRAIQPDPADRPQTIDDMVATLSRCLAGRLGAYSQDDAAVFVASLFGASDTKRNVVPVRDDAAIELRSVDIELDSDLAIPCDAVPQPEPNPSWSVVRGAKPHTVVFANPPVQRAARGSLFGERPSIAFPHTNVFASQQRAPAPPVSDEPAWPWPTSRSKSH